MRKLFASILLFAALMWPTVPATAHTVVPPHAGGHGGLLGCC